MYIPTLSGWGATGGDLGEPGSGVSGLGEAWRGRTGRTRAAGEVGEFAADEQFLAKMGTTKTVGGRLMATVVFAVVDCTKCQRERVTAGWTWANAAGLGRLLPCKKHTNTHKHPHTKIKFN